MGLQVNLCHIMGLPETIRCPKCQKVGPSVFDDYDIESGNFNPAPAIINLDCFCGFCENAWTFGVKITANYPN